MTALAFLGFPLLRNRFSTSVSHSRKVAMKYLPILIGIILVMVLTIAWLGRPTSWRNGEGSIRDEGEATASWLDALFKIFFFWM